MKQQLLLLAAVFAGFSATAQVLESEDFSAYTVGNVSADITGATAGQGEYFTFVTGGLTSDFQIVDEAGIQGNVFQMTGSATATGTRYMWKSTFADIWSFRDAGNDIMAVEYDFYTGPVSTSKNTMRLLAFDTTGTKFLGGLMFTQDTKVLSGLSYYNNAGTLGNFSFNPTTGAVVLAANTWVRIGFSFNKTTGQVICKGPGMNMSIPGAALGTDPTELDYISSAGTGNVLASTGKFDNVLVKASATDNLLGVQAASIASSISVYPNPASTIITLSNIGNTAITSLVVSDVNGRIVKQVAADNIGNQAISIADLTNGLYFLTIKSSEGTTVEKLIKN
jgi:hypothetical protein